MNCMDLFVASFAVGLGWQLARCFSELNQNLPSITRKVFWRPLLVHVVVLLAAVYMTFVFLNTTLPF